VGLKRSISTRVSSSSSVVSSSKAKKVSNFIISEEKESSTGSSIKSKEEMDPIKEIKKRSCKLFRTSSLNDTKLTFTTKKFGAKKR